MHSAGSASVLSFAHSNTIHFLQAFPEHCWLLITPVEVLARLDHWSTTWELRKNILDIVEVSVVGRQYVISLLVWNNCDILHPTEYYILRYCTMVRSCYNILIRNSYLVLNRGSICHIPFSASMLPQSTMNRFAIIVHLYHTILVSYLMMVVSWLESPCGRWCPNNNSNVCFHKLLILLCIDMCLGWSHI